MKIFTFSFMQPIRLATPKQRMFLLSPANGADNVQDTLPVQGWSWPRGTWLERRRQEIRQGEAKR